MRDVFIGAILVAIVSAAMVNHLDGRATEIVSAQQAPAEMDKPETPKTGFDGHADIVRIPRRANGHYYADIQLNRRSVEVLVDTGASILALRDSDAAAAGLYPAHRDFVHSISTANGTTKAAKMMVEEVEIGPLIVRNTEVFILPDESLSISLLGMNVLSELGSITFDQSELVIKRAL